MISPWRFAILLLILLSLLPLPGCEPVAATSPFYTDQDIVFDSALTGRWILYGDNQPLQYDEHETADAPIKMTFWESSGQKNVYDLRLETIGRGNEMKAVLFQLDGERFLDISPTGANHEHLFLPSRLQTHTVLRLKQQGDVLIVGYLNQKWVADEVPEERRHSEGLWDENPVLLLPTADLKTLLSKALKARSAFWGDFRFSRKDSESSARDLADYGDRMMAQEFMKRGDYEAALKALQQAHEARPDNHDSYLWLAFMEAATGDGASARKSVSEWIQHCRQVVKGGFGWGSCYGIGDRAPEMESADLDVAEHSLLGTSYFAEGNWGEAEREFELAMRGKADHAEDVDGELILFRSLALMQLGKKAEATAVLDHSQAVLNDQDKILVDYLKGKVGDADLLPLMKAKQISFKADQCNTECRTYFFIACRYFAELNQDKAREWFQQTLEVKEFLDLPPVIARLRLKQLDRK